MDKCLIFVLVVIIIIITMILILNNEKHNEKNNKKQYYLDFRKTIEDKGYYIDKTYEKNMDRSLLSFYKFDEIIKYNNTSSNIEYNIFSINKKGKEIKFLNVLDLDKLILYKYIHKYYVIHITKIIDFMIFLKKIIDKYNVQLISISYGYDEDYVTIICYYDIYNDKHYKIWMNKIDNYLNIAI